MQTATLTLLTPRLLAPPAAVDPAALPETPALSLLLGRSRVRTQANDDPASLVCALFGLHAEAGQDLPIAQLTWLADYGERSARALLCADPVHLRAEPQGLTLFGPGVLGISAEEADQLIALLNTHYADKGWRFTAPAPGRWYLQVDAPVKMRALPLAGVVGGDVSGRLPVGEQGGEWRGILNEIQMLLHRHPVNLQRQTDGRPVINSVWLWGGGALPAAGIPCRWSNVWSDQRLARGLAQYAGCELADSPDAFTSTDHWPAGRHLLASASLCDWDNVPDADAWRDALLHFETAWAAPLLQALRRGRIASLSLVGTARTFEVSRLTLLRLWRRPQPLHPFLHPQP